MPRNTFATIATKVMLSPVTFWRKLGPGLTTGASDDDPAGITTYSQIGAQYGLSFTWFSPFTFPFMGLVQEMCARIGLATGRGLAANMRLHFPRWVLLSSAALLFAANSFNIGADLAAMAAATQIFFPNAHALWLVVGYAVFCVFVQIFTTYKQYSGFLKYLALVLGAYIVSVFLVPNLDWAQVGQSLVTPSIEFSKDWVIMACALLGTTISPYLFFWQTSQEVEEEILAGKTSINSRVAEVGEREVKRMRIDVWSGMFISNIVMLAIIIASAATIGSNGGQVIETAADAARALEPVAGQIAGQVFAIGIIGTGLLAIPVLAGASAYAISESFKWREGLYRSFAQARAFYGVIVASVAIGIILPVVGVDPFDALLWSAVLNGIVAPIVLIQIVLLASNTRVMGKWKNRITTTAFGWVITTIMGLAAIGAILALF
jgi:NRAMP (natural resistance-associated macrophage protein)-like metal ion transporter